MMAGRMYEPEPIHCCLILDDGRWVFARCIYDANTITQGYKVAIDRHDMPDDIVRRSEVTFGTNEWRYLVTMVSDESRLDFNNPPHGAFPDYHSVADEMRERLRGN